MNNIGISCKCITYGRVEYIEESIESFLRQEYDGDSELVIVNDYPLQKLHYEHPKIRIYNLDKTFNTIGEKENFAVSLCKYDTIAVWDDDDMALPNHLQNINKYFPGHDLLHWNKGILLVFNKIESLGCLGNSGIVYSKQIWEKVGKHELENAGYDMTFVIKIQNSGGRVARVLPPDNEVSWIYTWGGGSYHMSGQGTDTPDRENVIQRHTKYIEDLRRQGKIPTGDIYLNPHWKADYSDMLKKYLIK
jgi:glycosyltransferase involved in cell wall biosynthesis